MTARRREGSTGLVWALGAIVAFASVFVLWPLGVLAIPLSITAIRVSYREMKAGLVERRLAVLGYTLGIITLIFTVLLVAAVITAVMNTS